jgi:amino acid adenylation domain-containing protein
VTGRATTPEPGGLGALVSAQARRTPDAPALRCRPVTLSYRELDDRAAALAIRLRRAGVGPEVPVGLYLRRSVELAVALLAVLKAGGACVPLDPGYPAQRLAFVLQDVAAPVLLTVRELAGSLPEHTAAVLYADDTAPEPAGGVPAGPEVLPDQLAWVAYTSGSTGRPKGVPLEHGALANLARGIADRLDLTGSDRVLQFASIGFSVAAEEVLSTWLAGACLVMDPAEELADSARLSAVIDRDRVTVLQLTPSYWYEWMRELGDPDAPVAPASLRLIVVGSEPVAVDRVAAWKATGVRLVQEYGATEGTVSQLLYETDASADELRGWTRLPIGTPLPGLRAYVLDERLRPVAPGETGELCLGGLGVTRGYLGLPGMTAERFLPDPFAGRPGARMYRTRDLVRRLPGGELEFLGRIDYQLNIRGIRIEPGEVESAIGQFPGVVDSAVLARPDASGADRLVGHVVWSDRPRERELRAFLRRLLPPALIPTRFMALPELPLNANGKVDRRALAELPLTESYAGQDPAVPPRTPLEERLLRVWQDVLGGSFGVDDDFFELGGDSLRAVRLSAAARTVLGLDVTQRMVFRAPTVARMAAELEHRPPVPAAADAEHQPERTERPASRPASVAQWQMWLLHRMAPQSPRFNEPFVLRLEGPLDHRALRAAMRELVGRHEALRTVFRAQDGIPVRQPLTGFTPDLPVTDLAGRSEDELRSTIECLARTPFDLGRGPLVRAALLRHGPTDHTLVVTFHHIIVDGASLEVLFEELGELYAAETTGRPAELPPAPAADPVVGPDRPEAGEGTNDSGLAYWRKRLTGAPATTRLPHPPPTRPRDGRGAVLRFTVPAATAARLREIAGERRASAYMVLLAAFYELIHRSTGARDMVVGTLVSGRDDPALLRAVGLFVNTLCLRVELAADARFGDLLADVRAEVRAALTHQDVSFERVVEELRPARAPHHNPLFQLLFSYGSTPTRPPRLPGVRATLVPSDTGTAKFDATLAVDDAPGGGFDGHLEYDTALFDEPAARRVVDDYLAVLDEVARDPDHPVTGS